MSRRIIRNAHSGAAGNQTICEIAFTDTKKMPANRAAELPVISPIPVRAISEPSDQVDPAPGRDVGDERALTADETTSSFRIPPRPQRASSDPTMNMMQPANVAQRRVALARRPDDISVPFQGSKLLRGLRRRGARTCATCPCAASCAPTLASGPRPSRRPRSRVAPRP